MHLRLERYKRILVLAGLLVLVILLLILVNYLRVSKPQNIIVSNLTETSINISWYTDKPTKANVYVKEFQEDAHIGILEKSKLTKFGDERDTSQNKDGSYKLEDQTKRQLHYVTIRNLNPETKYQVFIIDGLRAFTQDATNQNPIQFTTGKIIEDLATPDPLYGQIVSNTKDAKIVYLQMTDTAGNNSSLVSTLTSKQNTYSIDIENLRTDELANKYDKSEYNIFDIKVRYLDEGNTDKTKEYPISTNEYKPIDDIILEDTNQSHLNSNISKSYAIIDTDDTDLPGDPEVPVQKQGGESCTNSSDCASDECYTCSSNTSQRFCTSFDKPGSYIEGVLCDKSITKKNDGEICSTGNDCLGLCVDCPLKNNKYCAGYTNKVDDILVANGCIEPADDNKEPEIANNYCGDGYCREGENLSTCMDDCNTYECGNGICEADDDYNEMTNCKVDCKSISNSQLDEETEKDDTFNKNADKNERYAEKFEQISGIPLDLAQRIPQTEDNMHCDPLSFSSRLNIPINRIFSDNNGECFVMTTCEEYIPVEEYFAPEDEDESPRTLPHCNNLRNYQDNGLSMPANLNELNNLGVDLLTDCVINFSAGIDPQVTDIFGETKLIGHCREHSGIDFTYGFGKTEGGIWQPPFEVINCEVTDKFKDDLGDYTMILSFEENGETYTMRLGHASFETCNGKDAKPELTIGNEGNSTEAHIHLDIVQKDVFAGRSDNSDYLTTNFPQTQNYCDGSMTSGYVDPILFCTEQLERRIQEQIQGQILSPVIAQTQSETYSVYQVSDDNQYITNPRNQKIIVKGDETSIQYFADLNKNGTKEENEPLIDKPTFEIKLKKESEAFSYNFNAGWNLVAFPFISSDTKTAEDLLLYLNVLGLDVIHIAKYEDSSFVMYSDRLDGEIYSDNFELLPGYGYFVYTLNSKEILFTGNAITNEVQTYLTNGWNLMSVVNHSNQDLKATGLIEKLAEQNFDSDIVSRFDNGLYQSIVKEDILYGNDFDILSQKAYFVRIKEGGNSEKPFILQQ